MDQKQKIIAGAKQYADYIIKHRPQKAEDGQVIYYYSGSLAMLLLSSAKSIKSFSLDQYGYTTNEQQEVSIPQKTTECFEKGTRPITSDIDIVMPETSYADPYGMRHEDQEKQYNPLSRKKLAKR